MTATLAQRATLAVNGRLLSGMLLRNGDKRKRIDRFDIEKHDGRITTGWSLDLDDRLTVLALLLMVRDAWGKPRAYVRWGPAGCCVCAGEHLWAVDGELSPDGFRRYSEEREALVVALECAP